MLPLACTPLAFNTTKFTDKLPIAGAIDILRKQRILCEPQESDPIYQLIAEDRRSPISHEGMASTIYNNPATWLYEPSISQKTKDPNGLARIILHEITHGLGKKKGHTLSSFMRSSLNTDDLESTDWSADASLAKKLLEGE